MSPTSLDMTKATEQTNQLREGLSTRAVPQPCAIVIFGATGDLTHRKLIPALYNLAADGELPPAVTVVGFARRPKSDDEFRKELAETTKQFSRQDVREDIWKTFSQSLFYHQSEFEDESGYQSIAKRLDKIDEERGTRGNRLFYFAAAPEQFEPILKNLKAAGHNKAKEGSWARVIIEKPFGRDLASAQELNRVVSAWMTSRSWSCAVNTPAARSMPRMFPVTARKKKWIRSPRPTVLLLCG